MSEPSLIEITDDKEFMERVLKKSEEMQEETLKKAEAREKAKKNIRVGQTYEDTINATESMWIDGKKVEEAEIVEEEE